MDSKDVLLAERWAEVACMRVGAQDDVSCAEDGFR
jgi:hypothetical protein